MDRHPPVLNITHSNTALEVYNSSHVKPRLQIRADHGIPIPRYRDWGLARAKYLDMVSVAHRWTSKSGSQIRWAYGEREAWGRRRRGVCISNHIVPLRTDMYFRTVWILGKYVKIANAKSRWSKADAWVVSFRRRLLFGMKTFGKLRLEPAFLRDSMQLIFAQVWSPSALSGRCRSSHVVYSGEI